MVKHHSSLVFRFFLWIGLNCLFVVSLHERNKGNLLWSENFNDLTKWESEESLNGGGKKELQYYTSSNHSVLLRKRNINKSVLEIRQGNISDLYGHVFHLATPDFVDGFVNGSRNYTLNITNRGCNASNLLNIVENGCSKKVTLQTDYLNPLYSGKLTTRNTFSFMYGRIEMSAKIPLGDWLSTSFSMYPVDEKDDDQFFPTRSLDIFNVRGNELNFLVNDLPGGRNTVKSGLTYGLPAYVKANQSTLLRGHFSEQYYVYGMVWNPNVIYTYYRLENDPSEKENIIFHYSINSTSFEEEYFDFFSKSFSRLQSPSEKIATPFNSPFYLVLFVRIGGNDTDYWGKASPWATHHYPNREFYRNRSTYTSTWKQTGLLVDWIKVWRNASDLQPQKSVADEIKKASSYTLLIGCIVGALSSIAFGIALLFYFNRKDCRPATKNIFVLSDDLEPRGRKPSKIIPSLWGFLGDHPNTEALRIPVTDIHIQQAVGSGNSGVIWKGKYRNTVVAVKSIHIQSIKNSQIKDFIKELVVLGSISHENIISFYGVSWDKANCLCSVFSFVGNGSLGKMLSNSHISLNWTDHKLSIAQDIIAGVCYLHTRNPKIVHRDIGSDSILVSKEFRAYLMEFSIYRRLGSPTRIPRKKDTLLWTAPEILRGEEFDEKADIFSFGVVLSELITRQLPYAELRFIGKAPSETLILQGVACGKIVPSIPHRIEPCIKNLVLQCLALQPNSRPTAKDIHELLRQSDVISKFKKMDIRN